VRAGRVEGRTGATAKAVSEKDRKFVQETLAGVRPNDYASMERAEEALAAKGPELLPALEEALPKVQGEAHQAVRDAILRVTWKVNPIALIRAWVKANVKPPDGQPLNLQINPGLIAGASLQAAFPERAFYLVGFPQYPVARLVPEPLSYRNLFVVSKDGTVSLVTAVKGLEKAFTPAPVKDEKAVKNVVVAWLSLSQEIEQDGMFRFTIPPDGLKAVKTNAGFEGNGRAEVVKTGGNDGAISVTITFTGEGAVKDVKEVRHLKGGIRPICQATKLLDPDPIVRRMAEQDLLIMGSAARFYLDAQRATAVPELQRAIDAIWQRILEREKE